MGRKLLGKEVSDGSVAPRLRELAERSGGAANLARISGVSGSVLTRCLYGGEPSVPNARAICRATGVTLDWFLSGQGSGIVNDDGDGIKIPLYTPEASAGPGLVPSDDDETNQFLSFPRGALQIRNDATSLFAVHAKGDSMEPTIRNGSLLLVTRSDCQPREGIYVLRRNDLLLVKRTQPRENNRLRLKSDNEQYDAEEIDLSKPDHGIRILGRVVWVVNPV